MIATDGFASVRRYRGVRRKDLLLECSRKTTGEPAAEGIPAQPGVAELSTPDGCLGACRELSMGRYVFACVCQIRLARYVRGRKQGYFKVKLKSTRVGLGRGRDTRSW